MRARLPASPANSQLLCPTLAAPNPAYLAPAQGTWWLPRTPSCPGPRSRGSPSRPAWRPARSAASRTRAANVRSRGAACPAPRSASPAACLLMGMAAARRLFSIWQRAHPGSPHSPSREMRSSLPTPQLPPLIPAAVSYCPANEPTPCVVDAFGMSPIPPGGCSLLYEQGVAQASSIPLLARGPRIHTVGGMSGLAGSSASSWGEHVGCINSRHGCMHPWPQGTCFTKAPYAPFASAEPSAGVPVVARANLSVPGYRQHLAQSLLGAYNLPLAYCPGSLRSDHCRILGTPQVGIQGLVGSGLGSRMWPCC